VGMLMGRAGLAEYSSFQPSCFLASGEPLAIPPAVFDFKAEPGVLKTTSSSAESLVVALVGLAFEARIAAGPGVSVICRDSEHVIAKSLEQAIKRGCRRIISFGVAGGLAPHLRTGDWIIASSVIDAHHVRPTDRAWTERLLGMIPDASHAPIVGVDSAVIDPKDKQRMHVTTGALTVDIESHLVARLASAHGLSFAAVRVVVDPAHRAVPAAAIAGMRPGGGTSVMAILRELLARPSQLSGLMRVALDAYTARNALLRVRQMLGPAFGHFETGEI
jgi:adenosylhomocysteine nucleosidase